MSTRPRIYVYIMLAVGIAVLILGSGQSSRYDRGQMDGLGSGLVAASVVTWVCEKLRDRRKA